MIASPFAPLDVGLVQRNLRSKTIGRRIEYRPVVPTTMAIAFHLAETGAPEGLVVVTEEQTAGRGRFDRRWVAPMCSSLLTSTLLRPTAADLDQTPLIGGLAVVQAVQRVCGLTARLKWPNDVMLDGRKFAGMLIESRVSGDDITAVLGIGINVNFDPAEYDSIPPTATSISKALDRYVSREDLLVALLESLDGLLGKVRAGQDLLPLYRSALATLGHEIVVDANGETVRGIAEDVISSGHLLLRTADGALLTLIAGEVTLQR